MQAGSFRCWITVFCVVWATVAANAEDWQRKAVEMYPQLGVRDSAFNKKFWVLYRQREIADPEFVKNPQWPVVLAKECAAQLAADAKPKTRLVVAPPVAKTSAATPAAAPQEDPSKKMFVAKCGGCHDAPDAGVEEKRWVGWLKKWSGKAKLTEEEYDQLVAYGGRAREATAAGGLPVDPDKKLLIAKCGRCHDAPNPAAEEMTWTRWMWKWKDRAKLTNDEYDQLMTYAKRVREEREAKTTR